MRVSTATLGMHEAGAVPTRVLRDEATFPGLFISVCLQNCTENQVSTVTDYVTHC